jgi:hypothetical protein
MNHALVARLREMADPQRVGSFFNPLYAEAADEIERLAEVARRDREYCAAQTGADVALINQVISLQTQLREARS